MLLKGFHTATGDALQVAILSVNLQVDMIIYDAWPSGFIDRNKETIYVSDRVPDTIVSFITREYFKRARNFMELENHEPVNIGLILKVEKLTTEQEIAMHRSWEWTCSVIDDQFSINIQGVNPDNYANKVIIDKVGDVKFDGTYRVHPVIITDYRNMELNEDKPLILRS